MADIATVAKQLASEKAAAETPAPAAEPATEAEVPAAETELIGALDADQRIRAGMERSERTLWVSAIFVTLLYAALIAAQVMNLGGLSSIEHELQQQEREREKLGQGSNSISVEIVPEPDFKSKTEKWQEGANGPPTPNPPQPQQQAMLPQPKVEEQPKEQSEQQPTEEKPEEKEAEKPHEGGQPTLPDLDTLIDAAANDLAEKVREHYDRKPTRPQREQQATLSGGGMQVRGVGAGGKSDAFSKSVIDALLKTRPGPVALWGRVLVSFQITQQGDLLYVHVLKSSGNKAMDDAAVNAIHRAKFMKPPPDLSPEARTYIIDYIFG
jgi:protein TonB